MEYENKRTSEKQVEGTSRGQVRGQVLRLIKVLNKENLPVRVLMEKLELNSRDKFLKNYLTPALEAGLVEMTQPNSPNSPTQRYVLTEEGRKLLE